MRCGVAHGRAAGGIGFIGANGWVWIIAARRLVRPPAAFAPQQRTLFQVHRMMAGKDLDDARGIIIRRVDCHKRATTSDSFGVMMGFVLGEAQIRQ